MPSSPSIDTPNSFSTADAARRLGVSVPTVQRWVDLGHLKAWKTVGGHRRIEADSVDAFIETRARHEAATTGALPAPGGPLVLIVDDNPDDRDVLAALAEEAFEGAAISVAENGFQGLLSMGQGMPDVLITDVVMPHMNGLELLRHVATRCKTRPKLMVAVSSLTRHDLDKLGDFPPGVAFARKPIDADALVINLRASMRATSAGD